MKKLFLRFICWLVTRPAVTEWLIKQAQKRPYLHIGDYMHRWWLVPREWRLPFCVRIHHIRKADADFELHDHPANYRTFLLKGWYVEEDVFGIFRRRKAGDTVYGAAERFHRIEEVAEGGVWSLFILGRNQPDAWGFLVSRNGLPPRKVPWQEFVSTNNRGELIDPKVTPVNKAKDKEPK